MAERFYIQNRAGHAGRGGRRRNNRKKENRRKLRLAVKALCLIAGCALLLFLMGRTVVKLVVPKTQEAESFVTLQEAGNLVWLLADTQAAAEADGDGNAVSDPGTVLALLQGLDASEGDGYLTGGQARRMLALLPKEPDPNIFGKSDKSDKKVSAAAWYAWFDEARKRYDPQNRIQDVTLQILAAGSDVRTNEGNVLKDNQLVTAEREWNFFAQRFQEHSLWYQTITAIAREDGLYAVRQEGEGKQFSLPNVWVMQVEKEGIFCFWNNFEIHLMPADEKESALLAREEGQKDQIADISFSDGSISGLNWKKDKISGRLLKVADGGAEIEGQGFFPFSDEMRSYQLYGRMKQISTAELKIGYAFTDFVVAAGKIEAALVPKEEKMENIRVLIKTSDYGSAYHDTIELRSDCSCTITYGEYGKQRQLTLAAGETLTVDKDSEMFKEGERIRIEPDILTGHINLVNVKRAQGTGSYRGSFELVKSRDGIVVINELLLEEYLYAVVPSEMPSSYPLEALKSQAVCARTYAYAKMCRAGLPAYGAHVDDSTGFQVYQNIAETMETNEAVRETKGEALYYQGELAECYYYSTSCGYGADLGVWLNADPADYPYLVSQKIGDENSFYEQEEPWFRWNYEVAELDTDVLNHTIEQRYESNADGVLVRQADGTFRSEKPPYTGKIREISVSRYGSGGVAEELLIEGEDAVILIKTEHNIRYVLCDHNAQVLRQDGSTVNAASMVPSAFFTIETLKEGNFVVGYTLSGGGYGHGVGMSQNGAKDMAALGFDSNAILDVFYRGCTLENIYEISE